MTTTDAKPRPDLRRMTPDATFRRGRRRLPVIWLVPLVAAAIAAWLAVVTLREKGPTVTVTFKDAEGLEAGKTKVRYKEVEVGTVQEVRLSDDLKGVAAVVGLSRQVDPFMTTGTRFWVVRPRVGAGGVSGLGTLLSGAYIGFDPGRGERATTFAGLEEPPPIVSDTPGRGFLLHAEDLGSADRGSPVYYRGLRVGQVVNYTLDDNRRTVTFEVFVDAPNDGLVRDSSRFWNASGFDVSLGAQGINVSTQSLQTIVAGGIAFDTPGIDAPGQASAAGHAFHLYESRRKVDEPVYTTKVPFQARFTGSVRGLHAGSPVEFAGIPVGSVTDVRLEYDPAQEGLGIPVTLEIEPERVAVRGARPGRPYEVLAGLVGRGLRAQLKSGNLLTGELVVDLGLHPEAPPAELRTDTGGYPEIPSVPADLEAITRSVSQTLDKIANAPIDELVVDLRQTVRTLETVSGQMVPLAQSLRQTADAATTTLGSANGTLRSLDDFTGRNSQFRQQTNNLMGQVSDAARSVRALADYLGQHPDALLRGKR